MCSSQHRSPPPCTRPEWPPTPPARPAPRRSPTPCASRCKHLGVDVGVGYFAFIDTDLVRAADAHPGMGTLRKEMPWPIGKTYPLSTVGEAIATGIEERRRWVVVPSWVRAMLVLRTAIAPLVDKVSFDRAAEADGLFAKDVENRGVETASAPVGAGGEAAREREPDPA